MTLIVRLTTRTESPETAVSNGCRRIRYIKLSSSLRVGRRCFRGFATCDRIVFGVISHLNRSGEGKPLKAAARSV